ncbi:S-layer homology domain-containing protein, partial [Faecalitalea cylindroides]
NEAGVVGGYTDTGKFGPGDNINREQLTVMMYQYANYLGYDTSARVNFDYFVDV